MIFRNLIYKEWRTNRKGLILVVLGAVLVSVLFGQRLPFWLTYLALLLFYSIGLSCIFAREAKTIDFLDAKPITRTNLWLAKAISAFTLWGSAVSVTLACYYILIKIRNPSFSILSILFNPHFFFILLFSLTLCTIGLFITALGIAGKKEVDFKRVILSVPFLACIALIWLLHKHLYIKIDIDPFNFRHETLALFISYIASLIVFNVACYLALVHDETFSTGIVRHKVGYYTLLAVNFTILIATVCYLASIPVSRHNVKFIENIVVSEDGKQIAFTVGKRATDSQIGITDNKGENIKRIGDRFSDLISLTKKSPDYYQIIWRSHGWLYGTEIWAQTYSTIRLSEKDYRHKVYVGKPYLSPDKDRVAYVREVSNWKQGNKKKYLTIASVDGFEVPYEISEEEQFGISPLGWSPNGNWFYFRKITSASKQRKLDSLWAIDRNAQATRVIIEDFSSHQMNNKDLTEDGDWVSLVSEQKDGYLLSIMNTETNERMKVDSSPSDFHARAWSVDGQRLAYTKPLQEDNSTCRVYILKIMEGRRENILTKTLPTATELKWSPDKKKLLVRTAAGEGEEKLGLIDIDNNGHLRTIVDKLPLRFQYEWLGNENIVYTKDGKLISMNISQLTAKQLFPPNPF